MSLQSGQELLHYRIVEKIGEGGMGAVWKAVDTNLDREVAIKVLPAAFADDAGRLARFEREAKLLASLNHANIAGIYGLHTADGVRFLAMEYVPGEDLADRLERGPIPLEQATAIAAKMATGLQVAHDNGVIHRDLKPANVRLNGSEVKILDFGLAKPSDAASSGSDVTASPTMTLGATQEGVILGTAAYMSPEQARGMAVDRRADVWALGVVLFEMLSGRRLFTGGTVSDVLAAVLRAEPEWDSLPADTPWSILRLLRRCLARDPEQRLRDMGDAALDLREAGSEEPVAIESGEPTRRSLALPLGAVAVVSILATWLLALALREPPAPPPVSRLAIPQAGFNTGSDVAISPDGKRIAYSPFANVGREGLRLRDLDSYEVREVAPQAANPFFSPDGQRVAYSSPDFVFTLTLAGGIPKKVMRSSGWDVTGIWANDERLVLSRAIIDDLPYNGLIAVSTDGSEPAVVTTPSAGEILHQRPRMLPDRRGILFTVTTDSGPHTAYAALDGDGSHRQLIDDASNAVFLSQTGHLLYFRPSSSDIVAVGFDPEAAEMRGTPVVVVPDVLTTGGSAGAFAVSSTGTLIYTSAAEEETMAARLFAVVWVDRSGNITPAIEERNSWAQPRVSPDGKTLLVRHTESPDCNLWTYDLDRGSLALVTFDGDNHSPTWHPSGDKITFSAQKGGQRHIVNRSSDGTGEDTPISTNPLERSPKSWSADGRLLSFMERTQDTGWDIWVLDTASGEERPFLNSAFAESSAMFSPDGRWLAYQSNESGRAEIYVRRYPGPGGKVKISIDGGKNPLWRRDGNELFYAENDRMMAVEIDTSNGLEPGAPQFLFSGEFVWERAENYDIDPAGERFIMVAGSTADADTELRVVLNWFEELKRLAPLSR